MEYQKNTMSTLVGSIKSSSSLKDRMEERVPVFEREYEGKKSVIYENRKEDSSSQGVSEDLEELFSATVNSNVEQIEGQVAMDLNNLLSD